MEISLRLDTLGFVETRYLRSRDRYHNWPPFQLLAASRQARVMAYMGLDVIEQLHQQIVVIESVIGLDSEGENQEREGNKGNNSEEKVGSARSTEREMDSAALSPAFAQALERLNDLAHQRLPDGSGGAGASSGGKGILHDGEMAVGDEEDALEQLQGAFVQMMEIVRELTEELSTDALKITSRFRCGRTNIEFIQADVDDEEDDDDDAEDEGDRQGVTIRQEDGMLELEVELAMVLQLYEEGRSGPHDQPAVELLLDVDDFERLHETLDLALEHEKRGRRRRRS